MAAIADILKNIKENTGIKRQKIELKDYMIAVRYFKAIGDAMLEWKGTTYDINPVIDEIQALINWTYMLEDDLDFTKGILFKGNTGTGKTFLFRIWKEFLKIDNPKFTANGSQFILSPIIANARTIAAEYAADSYEAIQRYCESPSLIIDDIGAEPSIQNTYGNKTSIIADIIDRRNEMNLLTFGTTNLNKMTGEDGYDDRTARRMRELFNVRAVRQGYKANK